MVCRNMHQFNCRLIEDAPIGSTLNSEIPSSKLRLNKMEVI